MPCKQLFRTETGYTFPGVPAHEFFAVLNELTSSYGLTMPQICEAASYSMAMVLRVALGLSADRAVVGALVNDSLSGWATLAAMRHLANAGSACKVIPVQLPQQPGDQYLLQIKPLEKIGAEITRWDSAQDNAVITDMVLDCHALFCGLSSPKSGDTDFIQNIAGVLNEIKTPVHSVQCPMGIDPDSGARAAAALIASSTISLGLPLAGLHRAEDFVGRHYLCDISITRDLYLTTGENLTPLFAEQPVIQIFPVK